jgi:Kef-type K+ transport system membrane component KefB
VNNVFFSFLNKNVCVCVCVGLNSGYERPRGYALMTLFATFCFVLCFFVMVIYLMRLLFRHIDRACFTTLNDL